MNTSDVCNQIFEISSLFEVACFLKVCMEYWLTYSQQFVDTFMLFCVLFTKLPSHVPATSSKFNMCVSLTKSVDVVKYKQLVMLWRRPGQTGQKLKQKTLKITRRYLHITANNLFEVVASHYLLGWEGIASQSAWISFTLGWNKDRWLDRLFLLSEVSTRPSRRCQLGAMAS